MLRQENESTGVPQRCILQTSTVTPVERGPVFALRRSTLDFCPGGQRSLRAAQRGEREREAPAAHTAGYAGGCSDEQGEIESQGDYAEGHMVALGRGGVSDERGTPVT